MPNDIYLAKKPNTGGLLIAAVFGLTGLGFIFWALTQAKETLAATISGGIAGQITCGLLDSQANGTALAIQAPTTIVAQAIAPQMVWSGPGQDVFTTFEIMQGGQVVAASGVAGVHIGPSSGPQNFPLVGASQPEPSGCAQQSLCAYPYPAFPESMIALCGTYMRPGPADARIRVFQVANPAVDGNGFSSPTCNKRIAIASRTWPGKYMVVG